VKIKQNLQHSDGSDVGAAIAAVARFHFRRFGYARTSMKEIAEDCHMSVANLYRYHDGKLALGAAVAAVEQAALFAECDRAVALAQGDVTARLVTFFHTLIDGTHRQIKSAPLLFELGMVVAREQPEHRQQILRETETRVAAILAAGDGGVVVADPRAAGRLVLVACAPFILPWMLRTQPFGNPLFQVEPLVGCLVAGLTTANPLRVPAGDAHPARQPSGLPPRQRGKPALLPESPEGSRPCVDPGRRAPG
jgi:AcrR family transcriptional regulator